MPIWKLRNWIPFERLNFVYLSNNHHPMAIDILKQNIDKIDWNCLSANPSALDIIEPNLDKVSWDDLSRNTNPKAINLLLKNPEKINWHNFSANPSAIKILEQNQDKICKRGLCLNPNAFHLIRKLNRKDFRNKGIIRLLAQNPSPKVAPIILRNIKKLKRTLQYIAVNPNVDIVQWICENHEALNPTAWSYLASNSNADAIKLIFDMCHISDIPLCEIAINSNPCIFNFIELHRSEFLNCPGLLDTLCQNPNIFELDFDAMRNDLILFEDELLSVVMNPDRVKEYGGFEKFRDMFV